jgi:F-type H+-transporting ATPase subunit b
MSNVRGIAEDAARAIVERLIGEAPSEKTVAAAVADVLKGQ